MDFEDRPGRFAAGPCSRPVARRLRRRPRPSEKQSRSGVVSTPFPSTGRRHRSVGGLVRCSTRVARRHRTLPRPVSGKDGARVLQTACCTLAPAPLLRWRAGRGSPFSGGRGWRLESSGTMPATAWCDHQQRSCCGSPQGSVRHRESRSDPQQADARGELDQNHGRNE